MATEAQFVLLGVHARHARELWQTHPPAARDALGKAIVLAEQMLARWLAELIDERFSAAKPDAEDLLADAATRLIARFAQVTLITGKEFACFFKKILTHLVHDLERRRHSRRHRGDHAAKSLERDPEVARLALLIADGRPPAENRAIEREQKATIHRLLRRLSPGERMVARLVMQGVSERQIVEQIGPAARNELRSVANRLRGWLAQSAGRPAFSLS